MRRFLPLVFLAGLSVTAPAGAQQARLTVDRIWNTGDYTPDQVSPVWLAEGGGYLEAETRDGVTDIYRVDLVRGDRRPLLRGAELVPAGAAGPVTVESFSPSPDGSKLLLFTDAQRVWRLNTKGTYFVYDLAGRRLLPVSRQPGLQQFAKFSPDGRRVAFVRDHDLFVTDLATGAETRLTNDGSENVINGTSDWVYEEELRLRDAFRWSPDGSRIAFWRLDQSPIRAFPLLDQTTLYPTILPVRYPKAGESNATVKIGVVDLTGGPAHWMDLGSDPDIYVAAMDFAGSPDEIWLTRLNRHQNQLDLLLADTRTGQSRVIMTDRDSAWVDANQPTWVRGGRAFVFESEREGYAQLYLFRRDGTLERKLTPDGWDVTTTYGVDDRRDWVYFEGVGEGPVNRDIYRVKLGGGNVERLSAGAGTHTASFDPRFEYYVETYSAAGIPPRQALRRADGKELRVLRDAATVRARLDSLRLAPQEFLTVPAADGTPLNAWLIKPANFDSTRRYPLLLFVYGGPGSQTVTNAWGGANYLWFQLLAQAGYLVASVDNRGTGSRGRDFKKATYLKLGQLESADQLAAVRYFGGLRTVDPGRIGIFGWSYGGFMSSLTTFLSDGAIRASIVVAPVTDFRFYDTIYTERYLRTPEENPEGYRLGAPLEYADRLKSRMLIVHGTGDDNVHVQNTIQLIQRLEEANKQFDMRLYPNKTHSISGGVTRANLFGYLTSWLRENL